MTHDDARMVAWAVNRIRPSWKVESMVTLLLAMKRPARDAAVALWCVALDPASETPGRVNEDGPWWLAAEIARGARQVGGGAALPRGAHDVRCVDHPEHVQPCPQCPVEKQGPPTSEYLAAKKELEEAARLARKSAAAREVPPAAGSHRDASHVDERRAAIDAAQLAQAEETR